MTTAMDTETAEALIWMKLARGLPRNEWDPVNYPPKVIIKHIPPGKVEIAFEQLKKLGITIPLRVLENMGCERTRPPQEPCMGSFNGTANFNMEDLINAMRKVKGNWRDEL